MGKIVAAAAYHCGRRVADIALSDGRDWAMRPGHVAWIGIHEPSEAELRDLQRQFGLHELAVEDALVAHQQPKLELYDDSVFIVLRTTRHENGAVRFGETHIFAGPGYVISIRHGPSASYAEVRSRCEARPTLLKHGEDFIVYSIMDFVIDRYIPVVDTIQAEADAIEDAVLRQQMSQRLVERIHMLRRDLTKLQQTVSPTTIVCRRLEDIDVPFIDPAVRPYFRDVADHVQHLDRRISALHQLLDHAFQTGLLLESSRQNEVQRRFAAWAAILAVPTAIAGIYGMNFEYMPELQLRWGYFAVLGVIGSACGFLYWRFRRSGWL